MIEVDWYVAQVKSQQEDVAIANLRRQRYETYLPLVEQNKRTAPMFRGYLFFCDTVVDRDIGRACWTPGVLSILGGLVPRAVTPGFVEALRERGTLQLNKIGEILRNFLPGELVRIIDQDSPLQGERGRVVWCDDRSGQVLIILSALLGGARYTVARDRLTHEEEAA